MFRAGNAPAAMGTRYVSLPARNVNTVLMRGLPDLLVRLLRRHSSKQGTRYFGAFHHGHYQDSNMDN